MIASLSIFAKKKNEHTLNWEFVFSATGPLETLIRDDFRKNMGVEVFNTYGSTEQMFISGETIPDIEVSCGQAFSGVSLAIRSKSQIVSVKSNVVAIGVFSWNTVLGSYDFNAQSPDESIETADVGSIKAGRLYLAGRTDSMVVLGGLNVSLSAIENEARGLPDVIEAFAWAPNGGSQRDLYLFLDVEENLNCDVIDFRNQLNLRLGVEQAPKKIFAFSLPRTSSGKIDRKMLIKFASDKQF